MSHCPPIFIPFSGSISESPAVHLLIEGGLPFTLVTHEWNRANAEAVRKRSSKIAVHCVDGADKFYCDLLNAIRFEYAPKSGWFWLIHPAVTGFTSISSGNRQHRGKKQPRPSIPLDSTVALAYRFPISHHPIPGKITYALVDLFLHDSQTHVKIEETDFFDPPFVMCVNNSAIPSFVQFRGHLNEIRDFKLQLLAQSVQISTPNTLSAETVHDKQFVYFQEKVENYGIDSRRIDLENFALRDRWGKHICSVVSNLYVHQKSSIRANTAIQIKWSQCKDNPPIERIVVVEQRDAQESVGKLDANNCTLADNQSESKHNTHVPRKVTFVEIISDDETPESLPPSSGGVISASSGESDSPQQIAESGVQKGTQTDPSPKQLPEQLEETSTRSLHTIELPPANIRQGHVDTLSASMQDHHLVVDFADTQSVRAVCITYIVDDIQRALERRPTTATRPDPSQEAEFLVGVHFDDSSQSIEVSWNGMSCTGTMDNPEELKMMVILLQDQRIRKVCIGTYDLYRKILMESAAIPEVFSPQNTYDISISTFFIGNRRDPREDLVNDANREKSSFINGLISLFTRYSTFVFTSDVFEGFAVANQAIVAMASMQSTGVCILTRKAIEVRENMLEILHRKVLPAHLHCALERAVHHADEWVPDASNEELPEIGSIHFGFRHSIHTGRILTACRANEIFSSDLPLSVEVSVDGENVQSKESIPSFRDAIVAPKGMVLLEIDFSVLELQVFALLADEPHVMLLSQGGIDIYPFLDHARKSNPMSFHEALNSFECRPVSDDDRRVLHSLITGCIYGTTLTSLALRCRLRWEDVQEFVKIFHILFPSVAKYRKSVSLARAAHGAVSTIGGARALFPPSSESYSMDYDDEEALHQAMRFIVQGSVGDFFNSRLALLDKLRNQCDPPQFHLVMHAGEKIFLYVDKRFFYSIVPRLWKSVIRWNERDFQCVFKCGYCLADMRPVEPLALEGGVEEIQTSQVDCP
ncbi:DNA polymerase I family protein [Perkinsela sp. CCAP 1560/4]|nr:DNA polymerase I family protein [Perkinsela sp. CCAP 1560/4]|eukprot:KNH04930.1 DNA polymerase I family protein [Perkinsela sp. CCAP 1560/4]